MKKMDLLLSNGQTAYAHTESGLLHWWRTKMLKHGTKVRHKLTSAMGDGVVVGDSRFGSVDVCWHFDKTRIIKMKDGRQFTNWRRSERVQDLMVRN